MESKKLSVKELAELSKTPKQSIYNYISGKAEPKLTFIKTFLTTFPEINARWFTTGYGSMFAIEEGIVLEAQHDEGIKHLLTALDYQERQLARQEREISRLEAETTRLREIIKGKES